MPELTDPNRSPLAGGPPSQAGKAELSVRPVPRVAVVGVHGIAHHDPGATANAMANLLLSLPSFNPERPDEAHPRYYETFRAVGIQIPLQPVRVDRPRKTAEAQKKSARALRVYEERSANFARKATEYGKSNVVHPGDAGNAYTQLLLDQYEGGADGDVYVTTRLEGKRSASARGESEVHIYEVLWADLASPNNTFLSFFLALFQLILHLGSLSRLALDSGAAENTSGLWQWYRRVQRYAVRMLQIPLPLLKVILLISLVACIPVVSDKLRGAAWLPPVLGALGGMGIGFLILERVRKPVVSGPWLWSVYALVPGGMGAGAGILLYLFIQADRANAIGCWIVIGMALLHYVLNKYEDVRNGVKITGWVVYLICFLIFAAYLGFAQASVQQATFWTAEWLIAALRFSWWLLFVFASAGLVLGGIAWRSVKDPNKQARARAAVRTSRFALAMPALLFVQITSLIWVSLFYLADKVSYPFFQPEWLKVPPWGNWLVRAMLIPNPSTTPVERNYLTGIVAWSVGYQAPLSLALFFVALFLLGSWILPGAVTERIPLRNKQEPPRNSTNAQSLWLGTWLSRGLDATSVITFLFWCAMFVLPVAYYFLPCEYQCPLKNATIWIVSHIVVAIAGVFLAALVKYGSPVLAAVLDVDTYLRTSPIEATPRAKIFERYVSTLRYLARYRGPDGRGYDSVVIVAHSLGTLITADLLRFLRAKGDPDLVAMGLGGDQKAGPLTLKLLTMGSPIRQLLNRFFPYLYDWVREQPDNGLQSLPAPTQAAPEIAPGSSPEPSELGVAAWVNTYRSGDYVGRSLWLDEWYNRTDPNKSSGVYPNEIWVAHAGGRFEMCIGAGAHTHYWDDTAPDVAERLDALI